MDALWFSAAPRPASVSVLGQESAVLLDLRPRVRVVSVRRLSDGDLAANEIRAMVAMGLTDLAQPAADHGADLPAGLDAVTLSRDIPAADIFQVLPAVPEAIVLDGRPAIGFSWIFDDLQAVIGFTGSSWVGVLCPTGTPLELSTVRQTGRGPFHA